MWARMQDWPEAEKVSRMLLAMAPPAVQEIEHGGSDIPPEAQAQISQLKQTLQQLEQAFHKADEVAQGKQVDTQLKMMELQIKKQDSDTKRLEVEGNLALQAQQQTATPQEMMARFDGIEHMLLDVMRNSGHLDGVQPQQAEPMQEPPPQPQPTPNEPPQGGFFTPEQ
jgi:Zn-dependent oligopeptidase